MPETDTAETMDENTSLTQTNQIPGWKQRLIDAKEKILSFQLTVKNRLFITAASWGFLTGVERAIILPTLWLYLFEVFSPAAAMEYYGATLAAFNLSILVFSPLYGLLAMRGFSIKALIIISNQLEVVGNIIYFLAEKPWLVLLGRFVAGIGAGSEVPLYADIVRATTKKERTAFIVTLLLSRQFGLIIGPGCTLIIDPIKFKIGNRKFNVYNLPGLFMGILWALHTITVIAIYPTNVEVAEPTTPPTNKDGQQKNEEEVVATSQGSFCTKMCVRDPQPLGYLSGPCITTIVTTFATYFSLMSLESVLPPVAKAYFQWTERQTSYVYIACGVLVIAVYLFLRFLSNYKDDRFLSKIGIISLVVSYAYLLIVSIPLSSAFPKVFIPLILFGIAGHVFGQPFAVACAESLYTKVIPVEDMDRAQTIFRTIVNIAILVGPLVGGTLNFAPWLVFLIMLLLMIASLILLLNYYQAFASKSTTPKEDEGNESGTEE